MIVLYIILGIVALFVLIGLIPIKLDIKSKEVLKVKLSILHIPFVLTPKKEKPVKISDFKIKKFRKKRLKEQRKIWYKTLLAEGRKKRKEQKTEIQDKKSEEKSKIESALDVLELIKYVVPDTIKTFGKHLKISLYHFRITVGGDDPDKTALTYGYVCQTVSYLSEILGSHLNMAYPKRVKNRLYVGVDFLSDKIDSDVHISFKIRVWHLLSTVLSALKAYLKMPKK